MARESALWIALKKAVPHFRRALHMHRVENIASPGAPDVEGYLEDQGHFEFELKSEERPAKITTPIRFKMRDKQVEYAKRRWAVGGAVFWLLQVGSGSDRRVYMIEGHHGEAIDKGLTEIQLRDLDMLQALKFDPIEAIRIAFR